jgi:hypothetical protein
MERRGIVPENLMDRVFVAVTEDREAADARL